MKRKPLRERGFLDNIWKTVIFAGIIAFLSELFIYLIGIRRGLEIAEVRTMVLTVGLFFELSFIYSCKTTKPFTKSNLFNNKWMNLSILFGVLIHIVLLYTPLSLAFKVVPLTFADWLFVFPFGISGFVIFEISKFFLKENREKTNFKNNK
jgi:magnesium-transporting ATPase (P-type)